MSAIRFLVTGANGFVGAALCQALAERGLGYRAAMRHATNTADIYSYGELDGDTPWAPALHDIGVVIHLAARVHVMRDKAADPLAAFRRTNVEATVNLARQAANAGVRRFVFVSTIKVNGEHSAPGKPFVESDAAAPDDPYAVSKWEAEQALLRLGAETGLEVVIVRPPLVYGPGVRANFLQLLRRVHSGWPTPFKAISNERSLLFVGNLVDALILCATHVEAAGQTYLLDDGVALSSSDLVAAIASSLGVPNRDVAIPVWVLNTAARVFGQQALAERLTRSLVVSNRKICTQLGWRPPFTIDQGLRLTARWYAHQATELS
ncbi:NAD-dependent epimerase/dehydratase family protein [Pseudomonas sp. o96-267]|uniref:NAD-dependent epimerase/dehydratase family protein n=1 Tax=Pseudomonas sp. o96-267 TaxID=2479853 RepID=UPI0021153BF0|nr:NAD-dependent epimerase/dehydratase family protein [Pseudomonas sp. o96-267]